MAPLAQIASSGLGLPSNSYIYKVLSTSPRSDVLTYGQTDTLAVIASDDSLRFINPSDLSQLPNGVIKKVNDSVTCLERVDDAGNLLATAGRDGFVRYWDKRSMTKAVEVQSPHKLISSLVCDASRNFLACGTENPDDGPHESPVHVFDQRSPTAPTLSLVESHTDSVTSLQLHPNLPTLLLSASTDGLVNVFDTSQKDEEDALYQVINHRSAIHTAGFMCPSTDIYAFGTDETLAFYALQSQNEEEEEPSPRIFGDVRERLGCEYLAKMHRIGDEAFVACGKNTGGWVDLVPVEKKVGVLQYELDESNKVRLEGGHGEEVCRDMFTDVHVSRDDPVKGPMLRTHHMQAFTTYTVGEDGHIRAWKFADEETMEVDDEAEPANKRVTGNDDDRKSKKDRRKEKKEKRKGESGEKGRYKPY